MFAVCASLIRFVQGWGGGVGAKFIPELVRFHRKHVAGQRFVGGGLFDHLASVTFGNKVQGTGTTGVFLRYAILKAEYRCPADKVQNRMCKFIAKTDIDTLSKKSSHLACAAETILLKCREVIFALGPRVSDVLATKTLGLLDVNVIRLIVNKQQSSAVQYESLEAVACAFVEDIKAALSDDSIVNEWQPHAAPIASSSATLDGDTHMKVFNPKGEEIAADIVPILQANDFDVGMKVVAKLTKRSSILSQQPQLSMPTC